MDYGYTTPDQNILSNLSILRLLEHPGVFDRVNSAIRYVRDK